MFRTFPENSVIQPRHTGQGVRVKFGIDPTYHRLHLGHLVPLTWLRRMQDEGGYDITVVLGTYTACLGDPSGRDKTRPILSMTDVLANATEIAKQIQHILTPNFKFYMNHKGFEHMTVPELMEHVSKFTLQQFLVRDAFRQRFDDNKSIGLHELMVPVLQGLDSVKLEAEIEVGGQDQLFNFQIARRLQELNEQTPQICMMLPIIVGTDGRKMSKSFGNCIFLDERPEDIYGKVMSISDATMQEWWNLFMVDEEMTGHPMDCKKKMAFFLTETIAEYSSAMDAAKHFEKTIQNKEEPQKFQQIAASTILEAVVKIRGCSKTEARRLIDAGAVKVDQEKIFEYDHALESNQSVQVGSRYFGKINSGECEG